MQPFSRHTAVAAPLLRDDINTDQIAPVMHSRDLKEDYKVTLFYRARRREDGSEDPDFVLNKPQFRDRGNSGDRAIISAPAHRAKSAVWAMVANNIRVIVAQELCRHLPRKLSAKRRAADRACGRKRPMRSTARVVAANGAAPFTVDLVSQRISGPGGADIAFDIAPADRTRLLEGLDDIGLTLKHMDEIVSWEQRVAAAQPWLQTATDSR